MKIIVLAGGLSTERDVSLKTGTLVANSLIKSGHTVMLLDLYLGINNKDIKPEYKTKDDKNIYTYKIPKHEPDLNKIKIKKQTELIGKGVLELCKEADLVFIALHGADGENGKIQALFDIYGIKHTGTNYEGSLLSMNKELAKILVKENNILTPKWKVLNIKDIKKEEITLPCVIKPISEGSSVGVSLVTEKNQLDKAINYAKEYENKVIVEDLIKGREFSVGILNNKALEPIEIIPKTGFYDYENKYQTGNTTEICPADIPDKIKNDLCQTALKIHKCLKLDYYSRVDFILTQQNKIYFLEANSLPGLTNISLLPQEAKASGISYDELINKIATNALK